MSTLPVNFTAPLVTEPIYRLSVEQYHEMIRAGALTEGDPVELLEGILVLKMPKKPPHAIVVKLANSIVEQLLPASYHYRAQEPITLADGEPEPDGAIIQGSVRDYADHHPSPSDVAMVIEVADSTLSRDRGIKLASYARAGIATYWIVNLIDRQVEVYTLPMTQNGVSSYKDKFVYQPADAITLQLANQVIGTIKVADILP